MIELNYVPDEDQLKYTAIRNIKVELCSDSTFTELIDAFENFLRGIGYAIDYD